MKVAVLVGTRPEIIKMSPIIRYCEELKNKKEDFDYFVIHTGQHYSYELDKIFFEELELKPCKYYLEVGSGKHGAMTGKILERIEAILEQEKPNVILVEGDTNSVMAGALAAVKLQIKVGHVEAGLRSYDRTMPEEINRVITDHISDYFFTPTEQSKKILLGEGISESKIIVTGNTIVDAVYQSLELSYNKSKIIETLGLKNKKYALVTAHRQENVDDPVKLKNIFKGFELLYRKLGLEIVYPIHPRTKKRINEFKINPEGFVKLIDPIGYLDFLQLEKNASLILTDSGGVQEEACILKVPCVTLRENTERPETIEVGANILAGTDPMKMLKSSEKMLNAGKLWENPYGKGDAGKLSVDFLFE
ncbi:MAG: UDP-N-acetylglucosamine 2-epimerase (non-hydrolyzing) [Candidatus Woesearchaeota archaeon]